MNCLFLLVFPALLAIDAQARTLPAISLNNDLMIVNINAGMASSQLPQKELGRSSSSSMFHIVFEIIGWVMISNLPPKASSPAEQQFEVAAFGSGADPSVPKFCKRLPPRPAPPSSSSSTAPFKIGKTPPSLLYATPAPAPPTIWPSSSSKNDQIDKIINGISTTPSDDVIISMITDRKNDPLLS